MSDDQTVRAEPVRAPRLGLSGKLLVFTILFVMIAEVLIYVPSIANYRLNWLHDRLSAAYTAALVLDAAPDGMVPDEPGMVNTALTTADTGRTEKNNLSFLCALRW